MKLFKKLAPQQSIFRVATDAGGEFRKDDRNKGIARNNPKWRMDFQTLLEEYKEDPKKHPKWRLRVEHKKQPQRLIEALNGTLRKYVERVDFKDKAELAKIIARFVKEYNNTRHTALGVRTPVETISLKDKAVIKREAERQFAQKRGKVTRSRGFQIKQIKPGSLVRILLTGDKDKMGHQGSAPMWSKTIYEVSRYVGSKRGRYRYELVFRKS